MSSLSSLSRVAAAWLSMSIFSLAGAQDGPGGAAGSGTSGGASAPTAPKAPVTPPAAAPPARGASSDRPAATGAKGATQPPARAAAEFPAEWFWGGPSQRAAHARLVGKPAPAVFLRDWRGEPQDLATLKGKVVVLDFFGTWCGPCMRAVPKNIALVDKYGKDGLVFIGIHDSKKGVDRLDGEIKSKKIDYPVAVDDAAKSERNYAVQFWPTYVVIDRKGNVRAAGIQPDHVETVVKKLLAEPADEIKVPVKDGKEPVKDGKAAPKDGKATDIAKPAEKPAST